MKPPCPDCGHTHTATDTHALRRFEPPLAHTFAATYPGAPERTTRTAGRLERLEDDNAKLTKEAAETWDRILFERKQGDAKADEARKQAREERARCRATHGHALHTVGELRAMARRGAKTVRLATILDLDEGDQP